MEHVTNELPEIKLNQDLRRLIWRELVALAREHQTTRSVIERRKISKIFDALLAMLSVAVVAAPLIFTAAARM